MKNQEYPFVSIVVPAYNSEKTMKRCLESLLRQDYPGYEIIAVDNNSTDKTRSIIERYTKIDSKVKYIFAEEVACTKARVRGLKSCSADFIAMIDSDCFATKDWLKNHLSAILSDDNIGGVAGRTKVEGGTKLIEKYYADQDPFNFEMFLHQDWVPWGQGNNTYRKEVFEAIGYYDTRLNWGAGREFHRRMLEKTDYKMKYEPKAVIYHAPRGSLKELFKAGAKYPNSSIMRAKMLKNETLLKETRFMVLKQYKKSLICTASILYGLLKIATKRATLERVAYPSFHFVQLLGAIYGSTLARVLSKQVR